MAGDVTVQATTVTIAGDPLNLDALTYVRAEGDTQTLKLPYARDLSTCNVVRLINAAVDAGLAVAGGETEQAITQAHLDCPGELLKWKPGQGAVDPTKSTTPAEAKPSPNSTPANDTGAPTASPSVEVSTTPKVPGQDDGRTLNEQHLDPKQPAQDFDLTGIMRARGMTDASLDATLRRVLRNEAPEGEPHPVLSLDDRAAEFAVGDPIVLFTGKFAMAVVDLEIPSRGFSLRFVRTYRSGEPFFGPWGYNWDHSYNVYLRELTDSGAAIWMGEGREDRHTASGGGYEPPLGVFLKLERLPASIAEPERFVLSDREGFEHVFFTPSGWPLAERVPLMALRDRHGNTHRLEYDAEGRLERVTDDTGRFLALHYGGCGYLDRLFDHTGRAWNYVHGVEIEHLVSATSPGVPDHPNGYKTRYEYDEFQDHPALRHNMIRMIDPAGGVTVENEYGDDPSSENFNRVRVQRWGDFQSRYCATPIQYVPRTPDAINVPARCVESDEAGVVKVRTFNYRGDLLDERMRLTRDGSLRIVANIFNYDEQGNCAVERSPSGARTLYTFDAQNPDPRARGNLRKVELAAPPGDPSPSRIVQLSTYEPVFHRPKAVRDESGAETTLHYDFEEGTGTLGDVARVEFPPATLPDGTSQTKEARYERNPWGQVVKMTTGQGHEHRYAYFGAGPSEGYLQSVTLDLNGAAQATRYEYNSFGDLAAVIDGLGNQMEFESDALRRRIVVRRPEVAGEAHEVRYRYDGVGRLAREEWPLGDLPAGLVADPFLAHDYFYDGADRIAKVVRGANTPTPRRESYVYDGAGDLVEARDSLGRVTRMARDERGLAIRVDVAVGLPETRSYRQTYDRNGNIERGFDHEGRETRHFYDAWDRLIRVTLPSDVAAEATVCQYAYGPQDRPKSVRIDGRIEPGTIGNLLSVDFAHDERGRLREVTRSGLKWTFTHDADDRLARQRDPKGAETITEWDGLDRLVRTTGPLGEIATRTFDAGGRLVRTEGQEILPDLSLATLAMDFAYDARGRLASLQDSFGRATKYVHDGRDLLVACADALGRVTRQEWDAFEELVALETPLPARHEMAYDDAGRLRASRDPMGRWTSLNLDAHDRLTKLTFADGRAFHYDYGKRQARETTPGGTTRDAFYGGDGLLTRLESAAAPPSRIAPPIETLWDGLGRPIRMVQGGTTLERTYDAQGRLASETLDGVTTSVEFDDTARTARLHYPDGRIDLARYDLVGRLVELRLEQPGTLALTGALASGDLLAAYSYRGASAALDRRQTANGMEARCEFDGASRLASMVYRAPSGAPVVDLAWAYDAGDRRRLAWAGVAPGRTTRLVYDPLSRLVRADFGVAAPRPLPAADQAEADLALPGVEAAPAASSETYTLNDADARISRTREDGTVEDDLLDDTDRIVSHDASPFEFDSEGRCTRDDRHRYAYDALGHLVEIRDLADAVSLLSLEYDPVGRVIAKTAGGITLTARWLGAQKLQTQRPAGWVQFTYGAGLDEVVMESGGTNRFPAQDPAGSVLAYLDEAGTVLERYRYSPFGELQPFAADGVTPRAASAIDGNPRFAGHLELGLGLYDARARVLDPRTGRFLQPDPGGLGGGEGAYVYAQHNPIDFVDPDGEWAILVAVGIGILIGALVGGVGTKIAKPEASVGEVIENTVVGGIAGGVTGLTAGYATPWLISLGYGSFSAGVIGSGLGGASGGIVSGGWFGGRRGYADGGGSFDGTFRGAAYGGTKGAFVGFAGGAVTGGFGNRLWGGVVTRGALGPGEGALIRKGIEVAPRLISPASLGGNILIGAGSTGAGSLAGTGAEALWDTASGEELPSGDDWLRNFGLGLAGGGIGGAAQRYVPGAGMNRYAKRYLIGRTVEGNTFANDWWPRVSATNAFRTARGLPKGGRGGRGGYVHHERAVAGYPELYDDFDIMKWVPDEEAHIAEHIKNSHVTDMNPMSSMTHGPSTPRFPGTPLVTIQLGRPFK